MNSFFDYVEAVFAITLLLIGGVSIIGIAVSVGALLVHLAGVI